MKLWTILIESNPIWRIKMHPKNEHTYTRSILCSGKNYGEDCGEGFADDHEEDCEEEAASLNFLFTDRGQTLKVHSFLGRDEFYYNKSDVIAEIDEAFQETDDSELLNKIAIIQPDAAYYYCKECQKSYCSSHWNWEREGNTYLLTCPRGHFKKFRDLA